MMSPLKYVSNHKIFPLILWDSFGVLVAFLLALAFRFDGNIPTNYLNSFIQTIPFVILLFCVVNIPFGLYGHIWRYTSAQEVVVIVGSTLTSTAVFNL
jgi:FlaA1/EpsC-like NDP-sugar epimerase